LRGSKAELSWLMHTTYLSADTAGQAAKGIGEKHYKTLRDAEAAQPSVDDREAQIASIEVRCWVCLLPAGEKAWLRWLGLSSAPNSQGRLFTSLQASFEAAKRQPVHLKDPSLRPVEVLPGAYQPSRHVLPRDWSTSLP